MQPIEIAACLEEIAGILEATGASHYRVWAYRRAAASLRRTAPDDLFHLWHEHRLIDLPAVGRSIAALIAEALTTGRIQFLDHLITQLPPSPDEAWWQSVLSDAERYSA